MSFLSILYIILVALVLTFIFGFLFRVRGPWGSYWSFFAVIFLGIWAITVWMIPFGPYWQDIYWLPPLGVGIVLAILLAAAAPSPRARAIREQEKKELIKKEAPPVITGLFYWIFLLLMIAIIIATIFNKG
jgi:hypothetical protein